MRLILRFFALLRTVGRRPVEYTLPLLSDDRGVEERLLVTRLGRTIAQDLRWYPETVVRGALAHAEYCLLGRVVTLPDDLQVPVERLKPGLRGAADDDDAATTGWLGRPSRQSTIMRLWWAMVLCGGCLLALGWVTSGRAADQVRVEAFDQRSGQRGGYAVVDPQTGRIDTYDRESRRTGWGKVAAPTSPSAPATVDLYRLDGTRSGLATVSGGKR